MPTHWECPYCHGANFAEDQRCRICHKGSRPAGWLDQRWTCSQCGAENSNRQVYCEKCGYQPDMASRAPSSPLKDATRELTDSLRRQNESLLAGIQSELANSLKDLAGSVGAPAISAREAGNAGVAAHVPPALPPRAVPAAGAAGSFQRVTTRNLDVRLRTLPKLNCALIHAGLPLVQSLEITNSACEAANDLLVRVWVGPDYGEPWQRTLPSITAGAAHTERDIVLPLRKDRLQEVREAEQATLHIEVQVEGVPAWVNTLPLEVLAYNEWYYHPAIPETIACFVQPNSPAVEKIVTLVRDRLRRSGGDAALSGYQSGSRDKVVAAVEALYGVLQQDLKLTYINPPPSFEAPERLPDGGITISQKVRFPEHILEGRRGTCLDLALLGTSCLEQMGLHPLVFIVSGHVLFGVWLDEQMLREPVLRDVAAVHELLERGLCLPLNSVTCAAKGSTFEVCIAEGKAWLKPPENVEFQCAVDIVAARRAGIKPIPPLVGGIESGPRRPRGVKDDAAV